MAASRRVKPRALIKVKAVSADKAAKVVAKERADIATQFKPGNKSQLIAHQRRNELLQLLKLDNLTLEERVSMADQSPCTPLQFLMSVMIDPHRWMEERIDAAKALTPYFHRKMPQAIELPASLQPAIDLAKLVALPRPDREALLLLLKRIGIDVLGDAPSTIPPALPGLGTDSVQ